MRITRDQVLNFIVPASITLALGSLASAVLIRTLYPAIRDTWGYVILAFWALVPPIWFFVEWALLCRGIGEQESERIRHLHDLARNIWPALIVVLAAIMGVEWPFT